MKKNILGTKSTKISSKNIRKIGFSNKEPPCNLI